jgi:ABC-2 type transport system permease protein
MSRFIWLIRRELWEHKAIWIAPAIVIGCLLVMLMFAKAHLGYDVGASFDNIPRDGQIRLHQLAYSVVSAMVFLVMGIICFFYCIDSLYADRADRSVLFWKSMPLSDAETVLSKFATAAVVVPLVALAGSVLAQIAVGGGLMAKLAMSGASAGLWLHPQSLAGGALMALVACVTAMLWYAPFVAYLMLVSAWAPRGPFLWAVLPPVAAWVLERVVMQTAFIQNLIVGRLFGLYQILDSSNDAGREEINGLGALAERLGKIDWEGRIRDFYASPELWLGIVAAALLLAAAMWVRRYRDETS